VLNCGYGEGFSVLDVISAVKRAAKTDFPVRMCERRPGDPASLVAGAERIHKVLGWEPKLNDLDTIVSHSLAWEKRLREDRRAAS
jgi:UDP-glucose 4-epimerase